MHHPPIKVLYYTKYRNNYVPPSKDNLQTTQTACLQHKRLRTSLKCVPILLFISS